MTRLDIHLKQITLSATAIAELPFPPPKIFTNALLHPHDITALIRDTEAHERALFSIATAGTATGARNIPGPEARRKTVYNSSGVPSASQAIRRDARNRSAVAAVLGRPLMERIRAAADPDARTERGGVDVELLLRGAEELPNPRAAGKISSCRLRYHQLSSSLRYYEATVENRSARLLQADSLSDEKLQNARRRGNISEADLDEITEQDLKREEEEVRELEKRKRALEERVSRMEQDLGGLLR
ncbi:MAG: hypothetical protein M1826_006445 [Phylliscum demangeonii]|nr:MAG: hypothetical protein M1826_006445 [Phylliscum demangeonii]